MEALQDCKSQYLQSKGAGWKDGASMLSFLSYQAAPLCSGPSQMANILTGQSTYEMEQLLPLSLEEKGLLREGKQRGKGHWSEGIPQ